MIPIYITSHVPGTWPSERIEWTTICRTKPAFITIGHDNLRPTSRWQWVERKKKFSVTVWSGGRPITVWRGRHRVMGKADVTWYPTLAKAREGAIRKATEWHDFYYPKEQAS